MECLLMQTCGYRTDLRLDVLPARFSFRSTRQALCEHAPVPAWPCLRSNTAFRSFSFFTIHIVRPAVMPLFHEDGASRIGNHGHHLSLQGSAAVIDVQNGFLLFTREYVVRHSKAGLDSHVPYLTE